MSKVPKFDSMDADTVAELLGVTTRQLRNYVKDKGLPCGGDQRGRIFEWGKVREWYVSYRVSIAGNGGSRGNETCSSAPYPLADEQKETFKEALRRKTSAEADLKEIERAIKRREVVAVADAKVMLDRLFTTVKQKLLGIPSKLSTRLDGVKDRNQRKAILESEIRQACQEISVEAVLTDRKRKEPIE